MIGEQTAATLDVSCGQILKSQILKS
jgi:hypothetical protein